MFHVKRPGWRRHDGRPEEWQRRIGTSGYALVEWRPGEWGWHGSIIVADGVPCCGVDLGTHVHHVGAAVTPRLACERVDDQLIALGLIE